MNEHEYHEALLSKMDDLNKELHNAKRANSKLKSENRHLRRVIKKYKDEKAKERKPHYKNGRRGSKYNG